MGDNKKNFNIALAILIVLNISIFLNLGSMKRNLEDRISNLNAQISGLNSQLSNQTNYINQTINKLKEEQRWTGNGGYKLLGIDSATGNIRAKVNWSFRELSPNSNVNLAYGERAVNQGTVDKWENVNAKGVDKLNYTAEVLLSPEKNYKLRVQSEGSAGAKGEDLMDLDLNSLINNRFVLEPAMHRNNYGPRYENHIHVINNFQGEEFLAIKSAKAEIYVQGKLENSVELHKASKSELGGDYEYKFGGNTHTEIWLNDDAVWVKGEENWVKQGDNSWTYKGSTPPPRFPDLRIEVTIVDNMGVTYKKSYGQ
jgi:hypothetical protein